MAMVEKEAFKRWKKLKKHGDAKHIAEAIGVSEPAISQALKYGLCSQKVQKGIDDYFASQNREPVLTDQVE